MNIGTIQGGLVPNIVPESAAARLSFRIVDPMQQIIERVTQGTVPFLPLRHDAVIDGGDDDRGGHGVRGAAADVEQWWPDA